jgi:hypothetical protein
VERYAQSINNDSLRVDRHPSRHMPRFVPFNLRQHVLNLLEGLFRAPFFLRPFDMLRIGTNGKDERRGGMANPLSYFSPSIDYS